MRCRMLSPGFFADEDLCRCSPLARILFAGLWAMADRDGRLRWSAPVVHGQVLPFDAAADVDALCAELEGAGVVVRYMADGRRYLAIPSWDRYQKPHRNEPPSTIPAPDFGQWSKPLRPMVEATRSLPESESESVSGVGVGDGAAPAAVPAGPSGLPEVDPSDLWSWLGLKGHPSSHHMETMAPWLASNPRAVLEAAAAKAVAQAHGDRMAYMAKLFDGAGRCLLTVAEPGSTPPNGGGRPTVGHWGLLKLHPQDRAQIEAGGPAAVARFGRALDTGEADSASSAFTIAGRDGLIPGWRAPSDDDFLPVETVLP
mgnify:CR=1 FL=1